MTEPEPAADPTPDPVADPPAQGDPKPPAPPAKPETDWRAEAKKWEGRAKDNKTAADRLAVIEESQKTELQKAQERADAAEKRAADYESKQQIADWKDAIALKTGVPVGVLRGTTEEDIKAHAESLKQFIPDPNARKGGGAYIPAEGRGAASSGSDPAAQFADIIRKARGV